MIRTRVGVVVATAAAGLLALSACGVKETISGSPQPVAAQQQAQPAGQQQPAQPAEPRAAEAKLAVAEVGSLGAGRHTVNLAEGRRLAAGLYWVRLTQGVNRRSTRVAVIE